MISPIPPLMLWAFGALLGYCGVVAISWSWPDALDIAKWIVISGQVLTAIWPLFDIFAYEPRR